MSCCQHCGATEAQFGRAAAQRDLARYRRRGPESTTRILLSAIREAGLRNATLLDIGAGLGVLHHELLGREIASATHIDAASGYLAEARSESERRGHAELVRYVHGDFVDLAETTEPADLVTLDRVICCYPDMRGLVEASAAKARSLYALSMPHDRWYVRLVIAVMNGVRRLTGNAFRNFTHSVAAVEALLAARGFRRRFRRGTIVWHIAVYERVEAC